MMQIKELFDSISGVEIYGSENTSIVHITSNSQSVRKGSLFIARKGSKDDGSRFIDEALKRGATAILTSHVIESLDECTQIIYSQPKLLESQLATKFYDNPSRELLVVGITGTNGKTTTLFIIKHLLDHFSRSCGAIGTVQTTIGKYSFPSALTTPDAISNQDLMRQMRQAGNVALVMEVSSHALDQERVKGIEFDVAVFTNLTQDHLDYHENMEKYATAKQQLFTQLNESSIKDFAKCAVVNRDDFYSEFMASKCQAKKITYGIKKYSDVYPSNIKMSLEGTELDLTYQNKTIHCFWPLVGEYNIYNCLAAISVMLSQGFFLEDLIVPLKFLPSVPGRLQLVKNQGGLKVFVDYAHTDDALIKVLSTLLNLKMQNSQIIVVFGCGGDRDATKRPKMAQAVEKLADRAYVTSDNPRGEAPEEICKAIVKGFSKNFDYYVEIDRNKAIQKAIQNAKIGDIVLIAGKGHEKVQTFNDRTIAFDDVLIAKEHCDNFAREVENNCLV